MSPATGLHPSKSWALQEDIVYLFLDNDFFVAVSTVCIQLWSGGQHRVRLGILRRSQDSVQAEGLNRRAFWCGSRRLLAVLVRPSRALWQVSQSTRR